MFRYCHIRRTEGLGLNEERHMVWKTEKPYHDCPRKSRCFLLQGIECYFELIFPNRYDFVYEAFLRSKEQRISKPFEVTTYLDIDFREELGVSQTTYDITTQKIRTFELANIVNDYMGFHSQRILKFVFIFHGDVGLQLPPESEKGARKRAASFLSYSPKRQRLADSLGRLSLDFGKLLNEGWNHDVDLKCGDRTFKVHQNILCARSEVFRAMLQSEMVEGRTGLVDIKDMEADVLQGFLQYVYTGELSEISPDNARGFYVAGDKYIVGELVKFCADYMIENLTDENACEILVFADAHSDQPFKEEVIAYIINENIPSKDDQWPSFTDLHPKLAIEVLSRAFKSKSAKFKY